MYIIVYNNNQEEPVISTYIWRFSQERGILEDEYTYAKDNSRREVAVGAASGEEGAKAQGCGESLSP